MSDEENRALAIYELAVRVAFPFLAGIASWTLISVNDVDRRVVAIESSRYTQAQAEADRKEREKFAAIERRESDAERAEFRRALEALRVQSAVSQQAAAAIGDRLLKLESSVHRLIEKIEERPR